MVRAQGLSLVGVFCLVAGLSVGCSGVNKDPCYGPGKPSGEELVKTLIEATRKGDVAGICGLSTTPEKRADVESRMKKLDADIKKNGGYEAVKFSLVEQLGSGWTYQIEDRDGKKIREIRMVSGNTYDLVSIW